MKKNGWSRRFDEPIPLADGRILKALRDASSYIAKLPKREQNTEAWQTATEALLLVVEGNGQTLLARIGMMRALYPPGEPVFTSDRKKTHWGKRKLARDR